MIKKVFSKLNTLERVALVVSVLYGTGVIALLQHSALYLGFEEIDFLRVKTVIVGVQYWIYVLLPFAVLFVPILSFLRMRFKLWMRILGGALGTVVGLVLSGMMFHYFMPSIAIADFHGITWGWLPIAGNFWRMYFYWDAHIVGHVLVCLGSCFMWMRMCYERRKWVQRIPRIAIVSQVVVGSVWLMYFFNRDCYMNISQAACGGAPKAGIVTLVDPGPEIKSGNQLYSHDDTELLKPCFLLYEDNECALFSEMFLNQRYLRTLNENSIARSIFRYDKSKIRQFTPISYFQAWRQGSTSIITNSLAGDVIQHLDFCAVGLMIPAGAKARDSAAACANCWTTNMPEMVLWIDDDGSVRVRANHVSLTPSRGSNIVVHVNFPTVPYARGVQIWQWEEVMTNSLSRNVGLRIDNLPRCPTGYQWKGLYLNFRCNFIYDIMLPWEKTIVDEKTLMAKKKRGK